MKEQEPNGGFAASGDGPGSASFVYDGTEWRLDSDDCATNYMPPPTSWLPQPSAYGDGVTVECILERAKAAPGSCDMMWDGAEWVLAVGGNHCSPNYMPPPSNTLPQGDYYGQPATFECIAQRAPSSGQHVQARQAPAGRPRAIRREYPPVSRLNLIYHVYPDADNDVWLRNVQQLRRRLGVFNGRKLMAIATGPGLACPDQVRAAVAWPDVEYLPVPNDPEIGEVASFSKLLASVRSKDPREASFYAHTKGASNRRHDPKAIETWRDMMYAHLLGDLDRVKESLRRFACVGCLKKVHPYVCAFPSQVPWAHWHFCGTFFWFRHDRVFSDARWSCVPYDYWGAEMWLGGFLDASEGCSLYQPQSETDMSWTAYDPEFWGQELAGLAGNSAA